MQNQFIKFFEDYIGESGQLYIGQVKYKIVDRTNNFVYFHKDKILESLCNKLYEIDDIVTNIFIEKREI